MTTPLEKAQEVTALIEERAIDLALNDCQMWGNLPASARRAYTEAAIVELAAEAEA